MINLSSFIRFHALRTPTRVALSYQGVNISYGELFERITQLAGYLEAKDIGSGDVVGVLMKNSPAFLEIAFAVSHVGAVFLPINYRLAPDEVNYICKDSDARLLFADEELADNDIECPTIVIDSALQSSTLDLSAGCTPAEMAQRAPTDLFRLMYTSGTTDRPKGVMHSYENFHWKCTDHIVVLGLTSETRLLVTGPLYHVGAFDLPGVAVLWQGGMLAVLREFDPKTALAAIQDQALNSAWLAPVMTSGLLEFPQRDQFDLTSMRWVIGGGERTPEQRIRDFSGCFTNARYIDAYGLTESCSGDTFMEAGREIEKIGSTGPATPHVEIEIRDDDGRALGAGETGEICLRGPKIFKRYWRDPEKTKASFFGDWFRTGDVGNLDADGFLYLTDRKKDLIISGGENVASSEVERVIQQLPQVGEVAVIGKPDERWGEVPVAVVVCAEGSTVDFAAIDSHCRANLAAFKVPKQLVLKEQLPRNPSGKILKRELREQLDL